MRTEELRKTILRADPHLSRFDPLSRIILYDDFDNGLQGWSPLIGNYEDTLDSMLPEYSELPGPMLSNLTVWDTGTDGSFCGNYAMKLASRPRPGALAVAIKRLTYRHVGPIRFEAYFTYKPEASELRLSETDVRAFGVLFDLQDVDRKVENPERVIPHIRYLNALDGEPVGRWQYKKDRAPLQGIGGTGKTQSHFHLSPDNWLDIPGGDQRLCYNENEIATKHNWYYFRMDFDLASMSYLTVQCNDRILDISTIEPMRIQAMANLWCMLNLVFWVESNSHKRSFLYVDSVLVSGEWD